MERIRHRGLEIILGLAMATLLALAVVVVWESFSGTFSDKITVSAQLSKAGDALEQGDIVTFRNVIIGEVTDSTGNTAGGAVAQLKIDPAAASKIPATVTAVAVPASLFGNTKIELLPPARDTGARLHQGSVIAADRSPNADSLQTALANAYTLLTSIHPAQLDAALSALADALQGQGGNLNQLIAKADDYLVNLAPHLPELNDVIVSLATVTNEIARNAPDLLASLANTLVLAKDIVADKQVVNSLLAIAPGAVDNAGRLLNPTNVNNAVTVLVDQVPVTGALAANPSALANTLLGFKAFADTFNQTLGAGPYLNANILLTGADFTQLANVAAGQKGDVFHAIVNPPLYTAADCPRYPGMNGPNCGGAGPAASRVQALSTGTAFGGSTGSVGSGKEVGAVRSAVGAITGLPSNALTDITGELLLGPLLRGTPTVVAGGR